MLSEIQERYGKHFASYVENIGLTLNQYAQIMCVQSKSISKSFRNKLYESFSGFNHFNQVTGVIESECQPCDLYFEELNS